MMTAHPAGVYVTPVRKLYCLWQQDWVGGLQPSARSGNTLRKWFPQGLAVCMTASWYAVLMVDRGVISHRTRLHRSRVQPALHHCIWCIALGHVRLGCSAMKTQSIKLYMLCSWAYLKFTWSLEVCSARPWLRTLHWAPESDHSCWQRQSGCQVLVFLHLWPQHRLEHLSSASWMGEGILLAT